MDVHSATRPSPHQASANRGSHSTAVLNSASASANSPRRYRTSPANSCAAADSGASIKAFCAILQAVDTPSAASALRPVAIVSSSGPAHTTAALSIHRYRTLMTRLSQVYRGARTPAFRVHTRVNAFCVGTIVKTARAPAQCRLAFYITTISKDLRCLPGWYHVAQPSQKGRPGVGKSADAARRSACATIPGRLCHTYPSSLTKPSREEHMARSSDSLLGALDLLVLKTLARGPNHGFGIALHIHTVSENLLRGEEGSLYPALHRLE